MNDRQLRAFVAVGKTGSMSKAAGQMYISVPALKKQMDALEKEMGIELFFRSNQGVTFTHAGEEFFLYAGRTVAELDEEIDKLRSIQGGESMMIRIGYDNSYVLDAIFYHAVAEFKEEEPHVKISANRVPGFDGKKTDLFFGANYMDAVDVTMHYLCELPITCMVPKGHPLSDQHTVELWQLTGGNTLFPPREMLAIGAPGLLNEVGNNAEFIKLSEVGSQYKKQGIVKGGIGVAIGFEEHINDHLVQLPLKGYKFRYCIYSVGADKKPCLRQFIEFLKDYYPKKCAEMCAQLGLNA